MLVRNNHLQQGAQGEKRCETPRAYDDCHGTASVNPFWRNLKIAKAQSVVIILKIRLTAETVCREIALGRQGLTEDAMPLQRAGLWKIGDDADTVSSLPAIIAAEIWIAAMVEDTNQFSQVIIKTYSGLRGANWGAYLIKAFG